MTQTEIIKKHKKEILNLISDYGSDGAKLNKTELARLINDRFNLNIESDKIDSFRRMLSKYIDEWLENEFIENAKNNLENNKKDSNIEEEYTKTFLQESEHNEKFIYNDSEDNYYFFDILPKPIKMTGNIIREMKEMYSDMVGGKNTINEICRHFEIPRSVLLKIKTHLGWTHDSDPFTDEEWLNADDEKDIDTMVQSVIQKRKFNFYQKFSRLEQREILNAANKWWEFNGGVVNPFMEKFNESLANRPIPKIKISEHTDPTKYAAVIAPYDFHFGKYAWEKEVGIPYNRAIARKLLFETTKALIPDLLKYNIEKIYIPIGSDFYHIDTMSKTTTKGTPQDCDGTYVQIMSEGNDIMLEWIDLIRTITPKIEIYLAAGNHDYKLSHSLLKLLSATYRNEEDVYVHDQHHFRQYAMFGNTLMGFTHGDKTSLNKLPMQMAKEAKDFWAKAKFKAFFHGHLHHEAIRDYDGVKLYQMPSLSGSDIWHHQHSWEGSIRGLAAYLIHPEKGVRVNLIENIT